MSEEMATAPSRRLGDSEGTPATMIGPGMNVKGRLGGEGSADISGTLEGNCRVSGLCRVREGARVIGDIEASSIIVEGEVKGRLVAGRKVEIGATGSVHGDIRAKVVAIAEGALFEGGVDMEGDGGPAALTTFTEKRQR
ncbi:MAG TPA: polymer-forming cytoskeletal protein [Vicinamibacteria bacterium]